MNVPKPVSCPITAPASTWSELRNLTAGQWPSERAAEEDLLRLLESTKTFVVYRQIPGEPLWKHHFQRFKSLRADLLLLPNGRLVAAGWHGGAIVLEVKRSGEKIGPGLNQLIDYVNAVFKVEGGIVVKPTFGFLFAAPKQAEAVASLLAHQHVGTALIERGILKFWCGQPPAIKLLEAGSQSPLFWQTFNRQRPDLPDQSQSGYDLSLATLAVMRGWTDQQIANLIIAARRQSGQKPEKGLREDYLRRTLAKAKQAAALSDPAGGQLDLSALLGQASSAGPAAPGSFPAGHPPPDPLSIGQLLQNHPQLPAPVVHGLLREGETMNVISVPKLGKSWLVIDLALAVATGRPWLERFETEPAAVLIVDNQLHPETTANRIPKVARARGIPLDQIAERVFVENLRGRLHDLLRLKPYLLALPPGRFRIIILDAFYRFLPAGTDENDNGAIANLYNHLDECAARLEASFVLIHHTTKGSQSGKSVTDVGAGAGSQSRATDTHLVLRPHEEEDVVVLEAAVRSWPPVEPICLRWTFPVWTPDEALDPTALGSERPKRKRNAASDQQAAESSKPQWTPKDFAACLVHALPQTKAEILAQANQEGLSDYQAERLLAKAEALGLIHRWHLGGNRPGFASVPPPEYGE